MSLSMEKERITRLSELRQALAVYERVPSYEENPDYYKDWSEEAEFKVEAGKGECAV